jgi:predicted RNA binding protein YcfA (HicA-like mRNA interferase family)
VPEPVSYGKNTWNRLKNTTADDLIRALLKDGWVFEPTKSAVRVYRKAPDKRITVHYHARKTYGPSLLKGLLDDIGWSEEDLKRLKLI